MVVAQEARGAPVVDRLDTRALERRAVVRRFVKHAEVLTADEQHLELVTTDREMDVFTRVSDDSDPPRLAEGPLTGRLRIDLLGSTALRVRYRPGDELPAHQTPVLLEEPGVEGVGAPEVEADRVKYRLGDAMLEVGLKPLTLRIHKDDGTQVALVGGREKNEWNLWDSYNTGVCRTVPGDRPLAVETFALRPGEAIYGLGEQFGSLNKVGSTVDVNMVEAVGTTTPRAYKNVPFFVSTHGYGVLFNTTARMTCWVGSRCAPDLQVAVEEDLLDYIVLLGDIREVLAGYARLTGAPAVPPAWSFGWWQSKISYGSAEETLEVARRMREEHIPFDVLHVDTNWFREDWRCDLEFDPERFPDPAGWLAELRELGVRVCLWQLPYIPEGSALFDELAAVDGFVRTADGGVYDVAICYTPGFRGVVGCIDFTNPAAVEVYQRHLRRLFDLGIAVIKVDFGEQAPLDGIYHDGTPGHLAHNAYPLLYNRAVFEVTEQATGDGIIWARSAWAGSQRYPLHWGGDSSPNFDNLLPQLRGGLSLGLSGFPFWSQDIGGFVGPTGGSLLIRWVQAGVFLSHARIHGVGRRELYAFDEDVLRICRDYVRLRYRLLPYLYGRALDSAARGLPMARALAVEFQDDPTTWHVEDQWLLGDDLMVAPQLQERGPRRVYLPAGRWRDWWSGAGIDGPRWLTVDPPLDTLPLWVREGGVIPLAPILDHVGQRPTERLTLRVAPRTDDGERTVTIPVDDERLEVTYRVAGGAHHVEVTPSAVEVELEVWGDDAPAVELRTSGSRS